MLTSREEVRYLNTWFDDLWEEALEFREDLLKVIDFSGVLPESPYPQIGTLIDPHVLFKYLVYRWFEGRILNLLKRDILMEFQLVGVVNAVSIANFYNGVILADSVGLGKSFMASAVIEEFLNGKHPTWVVNTEKEPAVLLILPPSIISQWEELLIGRMDEDIKDRLSHGEKINVVSDYFLKGNFKKLIKNYTTNKIYELYNDSGDKRLGSVAFLSLGIFQNMKEGELKRLAEEYDLFVIDEAHKYRNQNTHRWNNVRKLQRKSDTFPNKFMLLTATPLNNSITDIFNLIRLFSDDTFAAFNMKGIKMDALMKKYRYLKRDFKRKDDDKIRKDLKKVATEIKQKILDEIMVLRTRRYIMEQFKELKVNGKPLVFKDPKPYRLYYSPFLKKLKKPDTFINIVNTLQFLYALESPMTSFFDTQLLESLVYELYFKEKFHEDGLYPEAKEYLLERVSKHLKSINYDRWAEIYWKKQLEGITEEEEKELEKLEKGGTEIIEGVYNVLIGDKEIEAQIERIKGHEWVKVVEGDKR